MSMSSSGDQRQKSLACDCRGAVMVVSVFLATFLVGALWYVIGVGDALLYRERMQEGADAVAYAAAVYHARGMNIIAMINVVMAAVLAVLVALKICQILLVVTNVVSCIVCAIPFGQWACPICEASTQAEDKVQQAIDKVQQVCDKVLPVLSKTQKVVAQVMPWLAEARAVVTARSYSKPVSGGIMLSASLVPTGDRLGLPVEEDSYKVLCKHAGMVVGDVVMSPFKLFHVDARWVSGLLGGLVSSFPGYFCGAPGPESSAPGATDPAASKDPGADYADDIAKDVCAQREKSFEQEQKEKKTGETFDKKKCLKDEEKNAKKELSNNPSGQANKGADKTPKRVFENAKNGNDYFQVWSVVWGDQTGPARASQGVELAAWKKASPKPVPAWGKVAFAQAEFYYDTDKPWSKVEQDALWNMRWRARLRRVRPPSQLQGVVELLSEVTALAAELGITDPTEVLSGVLGGGDWTGLLDGSSWGAVLQKEIGDKGEGTTIAVPKGYEAVQGFLGAEVIH